MTGVWHCLGDLWHDAGLMGSPVQAQGVDGVLVA